MMSFGLKSILHASFRRVAQVYVAVRINWLVSLLGLGVRFGRTLFFA
jgi:hypothetical protein